MKLLTTIALFFALALGLSAQQQDAPQVMPFYMSVETCQNLAVIMPLPFATAPCYARESVFIGDSDATVQAFAVTLAYVEAGKVRTRVQIVAANPAEPGTNNVMGAAFFTFKADVTIQSVQVTALDYVGSATILTLN